MVMYYINIFIMFSSRCFWRGLSLLVLYFGFMGTIKGQVDTGMNKINERFKRIEQELTSNPGLKRSYDDLTFYYGQMMKYKADSLMNSGFKISGYIDAYLAHYSDKLPLGTFQKFPTSAPISDVFGLNMAMVSVQYQNPDVNGTLTLHSGDIAKAAWSEQYNSIQEAHVGVRLIKKLWLESGFFRTHLGFESIQPRENIGSTIALTTYFEPYFLSGAKLTYYISDKWNVQTSVFNGFNTFVAVNKHKTYGFSVGYEANKKLAFSYNTLLSDETKLYQSASKKRIYNDFYMTYKSRRFNLGIEANVGLQSNSNIVDSARWAKMYSVTVAAKYKFQEGKYSIYSRCEVFNDNNEILTGPILNQYHQLVGVNAIGLNGGLEFKAKANTFLRFEGRYLHLTNQEDIFMVHGNFTNKRWEWVSSIGVWF